MDTWRMRKMAIKINAVFIADDSYVCEIRSEKGYRLRVTGNIADGIQEVWGDAALTENKALIALAVAFAEFSEAARGGTDASREIAFPDAADVEAPDMSDLEVEMPDDDAATRVEKQRANAEKMAKSVVSDITTLTRFIDRLGDEERLGWCSACVGRYVHRKVDGRARTAQVWLCDDCGSPTTLCSVPRCDNMAVRRLQRKMPAPPLCAEHRHDILGFEAAHATVGDLADYGELLVYAKKNVARTSKVAAGGVVGAGALAAAAFVAAPAVGGLIGVHLFGYSGAAATNAGLAWLGGGALAAGGKGMAGGAMMVAMGGAAIGGAQGAGIVGAYVKEDESFEIEKLRDGAGPNVVIARGFTTEGTDDWLEPVLVAEKLYGDPSIYLVRWGSKELKSLADAVQTSGATQASIRFAKKSAMRAMKTAPSKLNPAGIVTGAASLAANPWSVAVSRAEKTGKVLAQLLAKVDEGRFVLVGHSLGARVMISAAESLGSEGKPPIIDEMRLFGAAKSRRDDWSVLARGVERKIHNYHSAADQILKYLYRAVQIGATPVGLTGFGAAEEKIVDHDLTGEVKSHSSYYGAVLSGS